jgi:hypothetical protein
VEEVVAGATQDPNCPSWSPRFPSATLRPHHHPHASSPVHPLHPTGHSAAIPMLPSTRKRILLEPTGPLGKSKRSREVALKPTVRVQGECGRLLTVDVHKGKRG